ncbi:hypothetical protein TELCIR_04530 [Teladorsagia circumcincta]|uniref:ENTH domain-containing protein n=1 Tax=Teladorsagia circumcincta TaxID=45464 RepID=A0A2G9UVH6_TELCI|nr:hypothetical protein TELCIR_04530 [Teladorsagia circumcincta]
MMVFTKLLIFSGKECWKTIKTHGEEYIRSLEQYKYVDERGRDQGLNVRHRVKVILELLSDDDKLRAQRKKMKSDNKERYQGYTSDDIRIGRGGAYNSSSINSYSDEWKDDNSDSYKNRSSYDDSRDDYSSKEVNSFQFPDETRRGSASPELGFRQEPTPEEDFGDFASARSVPQPNTTAQVTGNIKAETLHIPAIRPPGAASAPSRTKSPVAVDLLGLDAPSSTTSSIPPLDFFGAPAQVQSSPIRPPRPPSGDGAQSASKPNLADNLFLSSPPAQVTSNNAFVTDWSAAPTVLKASEPQASFDFATFDAFTSPTPVSPASSTPLSTAVHQPSGLDDMFASLSVSSTVSSRGNDSPAKPVSAGDSMTSSSEKPVQPTKIGSTWAGASGLIDLDNLASKSTPVKQGLSLNQMQMNKQSGFIPFL